MKKLSENPLCFLLEQPHLFLAVSEVSLNHFLKHFTNYLNHFPIKQLFFIKCEKLMN